MTPKEFFQHIRILLAKDELATALAQLQAYLKESPKLGEVLQQSGRFANVQKQIRLGLVSHETAAIDTNKIRMGLLDFLTELESTTTQPGYLMEAKSAADKVHKTIIQNAEKIYNIDHIDNANFS